MGTATKMRFGVVIFPGSNCDTDAWHALHDNMGQEVEYIWHQETDLGRYDGIILPGGFSYGDYLRTGAVARFSPVMSAVEQFARDGGLVLGICNGFQILLEAGLLPGAMRRNAGQHFICRFLNVRVEATNTPFSRAMTQGAVLRLPIAHGEGNYYCDAGTLAELKRSDQIIFRYCDERGALTPEANPNGSLDSIAGICNRERNVLGLMPHPERASDALLGSDDGKLVWESVLRGES
jgi:phosphoribosylformylglycinamidine synthase subunit PurQ / glutaminase